MLINGSIFHHDKCCVFPLRLKFHIVYVEMMQKQKRNLLIELAAIKGQFRSVVWYWIMAVNHARAFHHNGRIDFDKRAKHFSQ